MDNENKGFEKWPWVEVELGVIWAESKRGVQ